MCADLSNISPFSRTTRNHEDPGNGAEGKPGPIQDSDVARLAQNYDTKALMEDTASARTIGVKLADLENLARCPICFGRIKSARISLVCMHRYCGPCIERAMRYDIEGRPPETKQCPVCRAHMHSRRDARPDPRFDILMRALYGDVGAYEVEEDLLLAEQKPALLAASRPAPTASGPRPAASPFARAATALPGLGLPGGVAGGKVGVGVEEEQGRGRGKSCGKQQQGRQQLGRGTGRTGGGQAHGGSAGEDGPPTGFKRASAPAACNVEADGEGQAGKGSQSVTPKHGQKRKANGPAGADRDAGAGGRNPASDDAWDDHEIGGTAHMLTRSHSVTLALLSRNRPAPDSNPRGQGAGAGKPAHQAAASVDAGGPHAAAATHAPCAATAHELRSRQQGQATVPAATKQAQSPAGRAAKRKR